MSSRKLLISTARRYPKLIVGSIILGFSGAMFNGVGTALIIPVLLGFLGQPVSLNQGPPILQKLFAPFAGATGDTQLLVMTGAILLVLLLKNIANYANTLATGALKRTIANDMRESALRMLMEMDIDYFVKSSVGDVINLFNNEIFRASTAIASIARIATISITMLVFIGLLLALSWQLTVVSTVLLAIVAGVNQHSIRKSKSYGEIFSKLSKAYSMAMLEVLGGMRLVRIKATEEREFHRIRKLMRDREQAEFKSQVVSATIEPLSEMSGMVALLLIVFVGRQFMNGQVDQLSPDQVKQLLAVLLTYLFLLFRTLPLLSQLNSARSNLANILPSIAVAAEFLRRDNKPQMKNGTIPFQNLQEGIHFHHITHRYPGQAKTVLKDVNLYLPRNTTLALVGSSGSGKSTLADLLPRFYNPEAGCVLVDGVDIRELDFQSLRRAMGIVSQDTFLFNASIRDNIAYGAPNATDEEVFEAARQANAYEFIEQLANGFATQIGDRGVLLSGGQRQRLAIARALLQNPEILILDEATSALDTVSERLVQQAIDNLSRDRTTLVIAHRLSTVQKADQIAVIDQGQVVELGSHEELLAKDGYYARLCELQFSDMQQESNTYDIQQLTEVSYELRSRLNRLVGSLGLVINDLSDNPEEEREWAHEAYSAALNLIHDLMDLEKDAIAAAQTQSIG